MLESPKGKLRDQGRILSRQGIKYDIKPVQVWAHMMMFKGKIFCKPSKLMKATPAPVRRMLTIIATSRKRPFIKASFHEKAFSLRTIEWRAL